ncbi:MAG: DUF2917 domain-containing protein [Burkholderiales bacterium]|nr:DUF2917 domain-containing protein [Burkholderiales bacterium]
MSARTLTAASIRARNDIMPWGKQEEALALARDRMLALRDAQGSRVQCLSGLLWVTEDQRVTDLVLKPGDSFIVGHQGLVLVMALDTSTLRIRHERGFSALARLLRRLGRRWNGRREATASRSGG